MNIIIMYVFLSLAIVVALLETSVSKQDDVGLRKAKIIYQTCLKQEHRDNEFPELRIAKRAGGMPLLGISDMKFGWLQMAKLTSQFGISFIFNVKLIANRHTEQGFNLEISIGRLFYPIPDHLTLGNRLNNVIALYKSFCIRLLTQTHTPINFLMLDRALKAVKDFIVCLRNYAAKKIAINDNVSSLKSVSTINDLMDWHQESMGMWSKMDWYAYLKGLYRQTPNVHIKRTTLIFLDVDKQALWNVLQWVEITDSNVLKNYALLQLFLRMAFNSDYSVQKMMNDFNIRMNSFPVNRVDYCLTMVMEQYHQQLSISYSLVNRFLAFYNMSRTQLVKHVFKQIQIAHMHVVEKHWYWMDEYSKRNSRLKLYRLWPTFGFESLPNQFYRSLTISVKDHYENAVQLALMKRTSHYMISQLTSHLMRLLSSPFDANSYYSVKENAIYLPLALITSYVMIGQEYLFRIYSRLGNMISHEIGHAFDTKGVKYNEHLEQVNSIWSGSTSKGFRSFRKCLTKQYEDALSEITVNNSSSVYSFDEYFADNVGIVAAFRAYCTTNEKLNVDGFNERQLFFLAYASLWCQLNREPKGTRRTRSSEHPDPDVRINVALSNFDQFARTFNCPRGTPMNPIHQCQLLLPDARFCIRN